MKIRYWGHTGSTGYAHAAQRNFEALKQVTEESAVEFLDIAKAPGELELPGVDVEIVHTMPEVLARLDEIPWWKETRPQAGSVVVAYTTFETSPPPFLEALSRFDAVMVPSDFCRAQIWEHSPDTPVCKIPHVRSNFAAAPFPDGPFVFYSMDPMNGRKRPDDVLRAYLAEFTKEDNVLLRMRMSGNIDWDYFNAIIASCGLSQGDIPRIDIQDYSGWSDDEVEKFHHKGHCYVSATRSEGFGLCLHEAAEAGRYVIASNYTGHYEFLHDYQGFLGVEATRDHVFPPLVSGRRWGMPYGYNCRQTWWVPSVLSISFEMRAVYEEFKAGSGPKKGLKFTKGFSHGDIGEIMVNALKEIA